MCVCHIVTWCMIVSHFAASWITLCKHGPGKVLTQTFLSRPSPEHPRIRNLKNAVCALWRLPTAYFKMLMLHDLNLLMIIQITTLNWCLPWFMSWKYDLIRNCLQKIWALKFLAMDILAENWWQPCRRLSWSPGRLERKYTKYLSLDVVTMRTEITQQQGMILFHGGWMNKSGIAYYR